MMAYLLYNATEIVRYFKTYEIWVFLDKIDGVFRKKLEFLEIVKGGKFAVECVSNDSICKKGLFQFGKIRRAMKKEYFLKKNVSILLRGISNKIGGQKFPVGSRPSCIRWA